MECLRASGPYAMLIRIAHCTIPALNRTSQTRPIFTIILEAPLKGVTLYVLDFIFRPKPLCIGRSVSCILQQLPVCKGRAKCL
jgi:hypothetical protein